MPHSPKFSWDQLMNIARTGATLKFDVSSYNWDQIKNIATEVAKAGGQLELSGCEKYNWNEIQMIGQAGSKCVTFDFTS